MIWFPHTDKVTPEIPALRIILISLRFPTIYCLKPELALSDSELVKYLSSELFLCKCPSILN